MPYDLFKHRHNFAIWAATRAMQRGWEGAHFGPLRDALESTNLREFVQDFTANPITAPDFCKRHRRWCKRIVNSLEEAEIPNASFGRAAKLVAIYLKSMVVVGPHSTSDLAQVAHPPIDRYLLHGKNGHGGLANDPNLPIQLRDHCRATKWTQLNEGEYYLLIKAIQRLVPNIDPFWRLERYWILPD